MTQEQPKADDINKPAGWFIEVKLDGGDVQAWKVYVSDKADAITALEAEIGKFELGRCSQINKHELTGDGMKPGNVKQWVVGDTSPTPFG